MLYWPLPLPLINPLTDWNPRTHSSQTLSTLSLSSNPSTRPPTYTPHSIPPFHFIVSKSPPSPTPTPNPTPNPTLLSMLLFTASAAVQPICKPIPHTSPLCHMSWSATTTDCWSVCPKPDIIFPHHPTTPPLVLSSIPDQYNLAPSTWGRRLGSYWHLGWCQRWGCV